ncbi:putative inorganic phosphate cotransporter [Chionoecetes opilio]|uniref:Sialin n=1 Tax=Chionoecetes opilio TaxID=41210 RepID=A0A8J5D2J0_CHIOP|nr:putative inorganic phosphate cotransporter [Chionoecetes opilio]
MSPSTVSTGTQSAQDPSQDAHSKSLLLHLDGTLAEPHQPRKAGDNGLSGEPVADSCWQVRYTFALLALVGIALMYAMRVVLSIAIVAMVGTRPHHPGNHSAEPHDLTNVCPDDRYGGNVTRKEALEGEFAWDETIQGLILGSFFWGYAFTNIPGGRAAEYFGGKLVFGAGIVLSGGLTLITPVSARLSTEFLIAVRFFCGTVQGVVFPAINSMIAAWVPPRERSRYNTLIYSGFPLGTVLCLPIGGWLCSSEVLGGWPSAFYLFGGLSIVWSLAWFALVHNRPESHPRISTKELQHIKAFEKDIKSAEVVPLPKKDILLSLPFWGLLIGALGYDFGFYTLLTELPTYLKNIQHFDMKENGLMSALPFLVMWLWGYVWGSLMDRLTTANKLSIRTIRRLSMGLALYGPMVGLVLMCFVNCNTKLAMMVLCVAVGLSGSANCGFLCSHQDMAPNFAGTLLGITNAVGSAAGVLAPIITGSITEGNQTLSAWRAVFLITVGVYLVTCTFYIVFITDQVQPWNEAKTKTKEEEHRNGSLEHAVALLVDDPKGLSGISARPGVA